MPTRPFVGHTAASESDCYLLVDSAGTVLWENPEEWSGGACLLDLIHPAERALVSDALAEVAASPAQRRGVSCQVAADGKGGWRPVEVDVAAAWRAAEGLLLVAIRPPRRPRDPLAQPRRQSTSDSLTGLGDRGALFVRLREAETAAGEEPLAVLYVDVDHFKQINDRLGHAAGDTVLRTVAERFQAAIRPGDTVARIGGDEFVVVATGVSHDDAAAEIAERVRASMVAPIRVGGRRVTATVSVGVAVGTGRTATLLMEHADVALYRAKGLGRNRAELYRPGTSARRSGAPAPEEVLGDALDRGALVVAYQPIVDLATDRVVYVEAVLRLRHGSGDLQAPDALLNLAEESGLIVSLGAGMLDLACHEAATWSGAQTYGSDVTPGLLWPMSARQLDESRAADQVLATLSTYGLEPAGLAVEVSEGSLQHPGPNAQRNLKQLSGRGVRLVVQDFGSGLAPLTFLRDFAPHALKLAQRYLAEFGQQSRPTQVVEAVLALGHAVGAITIAQGVDNDAQAARLRAAGCDWAQGALFGAASVTAGVIKPQ